MPRPMPPLNWRCTFVVSSAQAEAGRAFCDWLRGEFEGVIQKRTGFNP